MVLFNVFAAITLLPAMLGFMKTRVLSRRERRQLATEGPQDVNASGFWARWAGYVQRRPRSSRCGRGARNSAPDATRISKIAPVQLMISVSCHRFGRYCVAGRHLRTSMAAVYSVAYAVPHCNKLVRRQAVTPHDASPQAQRHPLSTAG
jgi:hypothetical protein